MYRSAYIAYLIYYLDTVVAYVTPVPPGRALQSALFMTDYRIVLVCHLSLACSGLSCPGDSSHKSFQLMQVRSFNTS